jgi:hypothetical protein
MRPIDLGVVVAIGLSSLAAQAGPRGGGHGGGGGPLSSTSSGLGDAARRGGGGGSSGPITTQPDRETVYVEDTTQPTVMVGGETVVVVKRRQKPLLPMPTAHFEGYIGASKVHDSDESFSAEVGVVDDWFRVDGSYTRYYEAQPGMDMLQLSMPKITAGIRVHDRDATIYLTGGVVGAKTKNDPSMDTSFVGAVAGMRIQMPLGDLASLVGNAELNIFSDHVTAISACAGVKVGPLQASLRVLDFNVGPPLYGPELGLRF